MPTNKNKHMWRILLLYNTQLEASDFVNTVENPAAYQYQESGATKENAKKKKAEEKRVDYMIKLQTQEHQQALSLTQALFNTVCGQYSESFLLVVQDQCDDWAKFRREKDLIKLLEIIDKICDDGSTGTKEDRIYVGLALIRAFYNFSQRPNQTAAEYVQLIGDRYDTLVNRLGILIFGIDLMEEIIKEKHGDDKSIAF